MMKGRGRGHGPTNKNFLTMDTVILQLIATSEAKVASSPGSAQLYNVFILKVGGIKLGGA